MFFYLLLVIFLTLCRCHNSPSRCNYQTGPIPQDCLIDPLRGCKCPAGYQLWTYFTDFFSSCSETCFMEGGTDPAGLLCVDPDQIVQCTRQTLPNCCKLYSQLSYSTCSYQNGTSCGALLTFNNNMYCVDFNANLVNFNWDPCPSNYVSSCMLIRKPGCVSLNSTEFDFVLGTLGCSTSKMATV